MATLAALLADVYTLTARPDLVNESTVAVKAATLKAHQSDFFDRDVIVNNFAFANPLLQVQQFNVAGLTRWRAWRYLQNFDPNAAVQPTNGIKFDIITADNLFDEYNAMKLDIAYQVGTTLNLRCSSALPTLYYGFYQNQDITNPADMGWISDSHPYAIIYEAVRAIFKTIGWDEQSRYYDALVAEQYQALKISNVIVVGS